MTTLTASSKYTARNGKEYGMVTEKDVYDLSKQGLTYNQIVNLLQKEAVNMDALRTDMAFASTDPGKTYEEYITKYGDYGYYDGGALSPTIGPTKYFMDPNAVKMLQAVSEVNAYDEAYADPDKNKIAVDSYNKAYSSRDDVFKSFGLDINNLNTKDTSTTPSSSSSSSTSSDSTSSTPTSSNSSQQYGVTSGSSSSNTPKEQPYVQWDAQFGMGDSKNGNWLDGAMKDAVGVGFTDTSKGQQFEQVLNSTEKKPANAAAGPDIFQTLMNSY